MRIVIGDQSPFNGGILRAMVLARLLPNAELNYFFHDVDAPWIQVGETLQVPKLLTNKWPAYWAVAARMPFTMDVPGLAEPLLWEPVRQTIGAPGGLQYFVGPKTAATIRSSFDSERCGALLKQMHGAELAWAQDVASRLGVQAGTPGPIPELLRDVVPAIQARLTPLGVHVGTTTQSWKEQGVQLTTSLPANYYWQIDAAGSRKRWDGKPLPNENFLVPGGKGRMLESAAAGFTDCFTSLSYLDEVCALRDRYAPGLAIPYVQMMPSWTLGHDVMARLVEDFVERKRARAERKGVAFEAPHLPQHDITRFAEYWRSRPTTIAYEVLGGELSGTVRQGVL